MKKVLGIFAVLIGLASAIPAQTVQPPDSGQAPLPRLKLRAYTITGLAKVVLPAKERRAAPLKLTLRWFDNRALARRKSPQKKLKFYQPLALPGQRSQVSSVKLRGYFGSFKTGGVELDARTGVQKTMPYVRLQYSQSDGHIPGDQAEWRRFSVRAGIQQALKGGGQLNVRSRYSRNRQHLWGNYYPVSLDRQVLTKKWEGAVELRQPLSSNFGLKLSGNLRFNDHTNILNYEQNRFFIRGALQYRQGISTFEVSGGYQRVNTERNKIYIPPILFSVQKWRFWRTELSLFDTRLKWRLRYQSAVLSAGLTGQSSRILNSSGSGVQKLYPFAEFGVGNRNSVYFNVRYHPATEILALGDLLSPVPYADLGTYTFTRYRRRATASLVITLPEQLRIYIESSYVRAKSFPVVRTDSFWNRFLNRYWEYQPAGEVRFWQNTFRLELRPSEDLFVAGWATLQSTEIIQPNPAFPFSKGNDLPYYPTVSISGRVRWNVTPALQSRVGVKYVGNRFGDLHQRERVDSYLLLNAEVRLALSKNIAIKVYGKNLLDQDYQEYFGLKMPGIRGGGSLEVGF